MTGSNRPVDSGQKKGGRIGMPIRPPALALIMQGHGMPAHDRLARDRPGHGRMGHGNRRRTVFSSQPS
jgi:hypothetical protein